MPFDPTTATMEPDEQKPAFDPSTAVVENPPTPERTPMDAERRFVTANMRMNLVPPQAAPEAPAAGKDAAAKEEIAKAAASPLTALLGPEWVQIQAGNAISQQGEWNPKVLAKDDWQGHLAAGLKMSVSGLALGRPDVSAADHPDMYSSISYAIGQGVGDLPASLGGFAAGGLVGAESGPGAGLTGYAGAGALPAIMRDMYLDHYAHSNEPMDWKTYWPRLVDMMKDVRNQTVAAMVGGKFGEVVGGKIVKNALAREFMEDGIDRDTASQWAKSVHERGLTEAKFHHHLAATTAETVGYTAAGTAMDQAVPSQNDIVSTAVFSLASHGMEHAIHTAAQVAPKVMAKKATQKALKSAVTTMYEGGKVGGDLTPEGQTLVNNLADAWRRTGLPMHEIQGLAAKDTAIDHELMATTPSGEPPMFQEIDKYAKVDPPKPANDNATPPKPLDLSATQLNDLIARKRGETDAPIEKMLDFENPKQSADGDDLVEHIRHLGWDGAALDKYTALSPAERSYVKDKYASRNGLRAVQEGLSPVEKDSIEAANQMSQGEFEDVVKRMVADTSGEAAKPPAPPTRTPEEEKIAERIGERVDRKPDIFDTRKWYQQWVNKLAPLEETTEHYLPGVTGVRNPAALARWTADSPMRAGVMLRDGVVDPDKLTVSDPNTSLLAAVKAAKVRGGDAQGFDIYLAARRALEKEGQGIKTGFDVDAAKGVLAQGNEKYAAAAKIFDDFHAGLMNYVQKSGLFSAEQMKTINDLNKSYVPFARLFGAEKAVQATGRGLRVRNPVRKMTGSNAPILSPMQAMIENTHTLVMMADRNRVMQPIADALRKDPKAFGDEIARSSQPARPVTIKDDEMSKYLEEHGIEDGTEHPLTVWRRFNKGLGDDEAMFFNNGQAEIYKFVDPDLAQVFKRITPEEANLALRILKIPAKWARAGITGVPDFALKHGLGWQLNTKVFTDIGYHPFTDMFRGMSSVLGRDKDFQDFMMRGGFGMSMSRYDADYIQRDIDKVFNKTGTWNNVWNVARNPLRASHILMENLSAMSGVGYYKRTMTGDLNHDMNQAMKVRRALIDYTQRGSSQLVNGWAQTTTFMNPSLLSIEQIVRSFKEKPVSTILKGLVWSAMPSAALWFLNAQVDQQLKAQGKEDLMWSNHARWIQDLYWGIPMPLPQGGWTHILIPKHFAGLMFGSSTERMLDHFVANDPRAFKDLGGTIAAEFMPFKRWIPTVLEPIVEAWGNRNLQTNTPLVSDRLMQASGPMRYTPYTSEIAKRVSQVIAPPVRAMGGPEVSPIVIERYWKDWFGGPGMTALRLMDRALHPDVGRPPFQAADLPFVQSFLARNPGVTSKPITDFRDEYGKFQRAHADFQLAMKRQDFSEIKASAKDIRAFINLSQIEQSLNTQETMIDAINSNAKMNDGDKRRLTDGYVQGMILTAQAGLNTIDAINKEQPNGRP